MTIMKNIRVRRYGFHGTSHSFVSKRSGRDSLENHMIRRRPSYATLETDQVSAAVENGKSVDTSMGLTPLEGLVMGTRSGDMDPAIVEFIANKERSGYCRCDEMY